MEEMIVSNLGARRQVMCCHLHKSGQERGQAAAALTGAPATVEAAAAEDVLKVCCSQSSSA